MHKILLTEESSISYRIEPFYFKKDFSKINSLNGFKPLSFTKDMFYNHINQLMFLKESDPAYKNQIGKSFLLDWETKDPIKYFNSYLKEEKLFPLRGTEYEYLVREFKDEQTKESKLKKYIRFKIENVQLLISEMQVGFLVYDLKVLELYDVEKGEKKIYPQTLENYDWVMYYLRKMQHAKKGKLRAFIRDPEDIKQQNNYNKRKEAAFKNGRSFTEEKPDKQGEFSIPVKWTDLVTGLLNQIGDVYSFTNQKQVGHHSLLYSSAFIKTPDYLNQSNETHELSLTRENYELAVANKVYKVSHGYRETYYKECTTEDVLRTFDNIMWSLSAEGVSNIVYSVPNKQAMKFFDESFKRKQETNYYYMYVLALMQKYSLLYYSMRTADILFQSSVYIGQELSREERDEELQRTRSFHAKTLKFTIHGYYEQVSYHSHYNDLYENLIKSLRIPELQQELSPKMTAFTQVIETLVHEQNIKEKEEIKEAAKILHNEEKRTQEKQNNIIQTITYFLLPATLTTGILGMNIPFIDHSQDIYLVYAILLVTLFTASLSVSLNKEIKGIPAKTVIVAAIILLVLTYTLDQAFNKPKQIEKKTEQVQTNEKK
ncbi:CorA family divalent cation transporter [Bacillus thuringiensis]|uniref:CorA family divalent cation transporter n=1 Tax=Bacillus thuringiensis TaxID=1428 RepID=UPI000BFD5143|nr:CorA family divalent cation transporter [Bacillus thuringiensis]PGW74484.1 hypothetical protein COE21_21350 [Bacillus thuringiensis]